MDTYEFGYEGETLEAAVNDLKQVYFNLRSVARIIGVKPSALQGAAPGREYLAENSHEKYLDEFHFYRLTLPEGKYPAASKRLEALQCACGKEFVPQLHTHLLNEAVEAALETDSDGLNTQFKEELEFARERCSEAEKQAEAVLSLFREQKEVLSKAGALNEELYNRNLELNRQLKAARG